MFGSPTPTKQTRCPASSRAAATIIISFFEKLAASTLTGCVPSTLPTGRRATASPLLDGCPPAMSRSYLRNAVSRPPERLEAQAATSADSAGARRRSRALLPFPRRDGGAGTGTRGRPSSGPRTAGCPPRPTAIRAMAGRAHGRRRPPATGSDPPRRCSPPTARPRPVAPRSGTPSASARDGPGQPDDPSPPDVLDQAELALRLVDDPLSDQPRVDDAVDPCRAGTRMPPPPGQATDHQRDERTDDHDDATHHALLRSRRAWRAGVLARESRMDRTSASSVATRWWGPPRGGGCGGSGGAPSSGPPRGGGR